MQTQSNADPVTRVIKMCHRGESEANRIYHMLAEEHQHQIRLDDNTELELNDEQIGEFVMRFSAEVEPEYWKSKQRKD